MTSKAARFITQLMAEIAERDARIAELEASKAAADDMFRSLGGEIYELNAKLAALKAQPLSLAMEVETEGWWNESHDVYTWPIRIANWGARIECHGNTPTEAQQLAMSVVHSQQPSACVLGGTGISSSMRGALAEAGQQPASGGAYSSDPLACSGCAAGCFRCRSSAGVVVGALVSALEGIVHDERVPNEVSQDYAALLIEARRLNPCRAQAVADDLRAAAENCAFVMRYIGSMGPDEIDGDNVELLFEDEYGRDTGADASIVEYAEKVADLLDALLAAPSANSEQARSCVTCNGVGIIGHSTICPECTIPSTQQKEPDDE